MASDTTVKILITISPPEGATPAERAEAVSEILQLIDTLESLTQGSPRKQKRISLDSVRCRRRDESALLKSEGYAALSGQAVQAGVYTTPPEVVAAIQAPPQPEDPGKLPASLPEGCRPADADAILSQADPAPEETNAALRSPAMSDEQIGAELLRLRDSGMEAKQIREAMHEKGTDLSLLEIRHRLTVLARMPLPFPRNPSQTDMDAMILDMAAQNKTPYEICIVVGR